MFKLQNYLHKSKQIIKLKSIQSLMLFKPHNHKLHSSSIYIIFQSKNKTVYIPNMKMSLHKFRLDVISVKFNNN